jgi:hypothetical protein
MTNFEISIFHKMPAAAAAAVIAATAAAAANNFRHNSGYAPHPIFFRVDDI